jgi:hypothetical protein
MRPIGVTIIGILQILAGILRILGALALFGLVGLGLAGNLEGSVGFLGIVIGVLMLIIGLAYFYLGWSMLALRPWAWTATLFLNAIAIAAAVGQFFVGGFDWNATLSAIIPLIIIAYLFSSRVRSAFRV